MKNKIKNEKDTNQEFDKIIRSYNIPPRPEIISEINRCGNDIQKISEAIKNDVALSSGLLQIVNSPFYGLKNHISSIQQASVLLGVEAVKNIVNCQVLKATSEGYKNKDLADFWQSSTEVANTSVMIVHALGFGSPDEAYTLGLFHNCGIPILMEKHANYAETLQLAYSTDNHRITEIENECHSTNHAVIGYMVSRVWKLPEHMRIAIRDHHNFERLDFEKTEYGTEADTMLAILKMAEHISRVHIVVGKDHEDNEWNSIKNGLLEFLGISELDFEEISAMIENKIGMY